MQCSFNVPEIMGAFRKYHGGYKSPTPTEKPLRYIYIYSYKNQVICFIDKFVSSIGLDYDTIKKSFDVEFRHDFAPSTFRT